jgi:hypothetical protein
MSDRLPKIKFKSTSAVAYWMVFLVMMDIPIGLPPLFLTFDPPLFWIHVLVNIHVCQ